MKDYSLTIEERREFILNYLVKDDKIVINNRLTEYFAKKVEEMNGKVIDKEPCNAIISLKSRYFNSFFACTAFCDTLRPNPAVETRAVCVRFVV